MAGHEVGLVDQIGRFDRFLAEPQVRYGDAAGFLGVVGEIRLRVHVGVIADDLDRGLVRADRAVGAEAPELAGGGADRRGVDVFSRRQRGEGDVVDDAQREPVLGNGQLQVFEDRQDVGRNDVLGTEAVATANDQRLPFLAVEGALHVKVQRLTEGTGLFGAVQHRDLLHSLGNVAEEMFERERSVQVDGQQTDLFPLAIQVVDGFLDDVARRAHRHNDAVGVRRAVIVEQMILAAGQFLDLGHIGLDDLGNRVIVGVGDFTLLEVDVRILRGSPHHRVIRVQGPAAESVQGILVDQAGQFVVFDDLDLLGLMRGPEAVEEVHERNPALDRRQMGYRGQVHDLLDAAFREHGETGLARRHDVLMVAEDAQRVGRHRAGADVKHARQQFAGDFIHVGNHKQQTLGSGEGRRQGAGLQGTVHRAGGAAFRLHLRDPHGLPEDVLPALGAPLVHMLGHGGGRRNRENRRDIGEPVGNVGRRVVPVHGFHFSHAVNPSFVFFSFGIAAA